MTCPHKAEDELRTNSSAVRQARLQRNQSLVAIVGNGDNALSVRRVKSGARSSMNHADGRKRPVSAGRYASGEWRTAH